MSYIRTIDGITVSEKNFSFIHLQELFPQTSFPSDYFSGKYDRDLSEIGIYPVLETLSPPIDPESQYIEQGDVVKDGEQWIQTWEIKNYTPEEIRTRKYDPKSFLQSMAINSFFIQWQGIIFDTPNSQDNAWLLTLRDAATQQNWLMVQSCYFHLRHDQNIPLPDGAEVEWQELADRYGIPIQFALPVEVLEPEIPLE